MPYRDLREFLDVLDKDRQLCRVKELTDPKFEIGAICDKVFREYGQNANPALVFENLKGHSSVLAVNVLSNPKRVARAIECSEHEFNGEWIRRSSSTIEPVMVRDGPCQEVIQKGKDVDLGNLPVPVWNRDDGGPFITFTCQITNDPESGVRNVGMYRSQVFDRSTLGIYAAPFRHLSMQARKAHAANRSFPVALAIGLDPVIPLAAVAPFPFGVDELGVAGALRGAPVEIVKCLTVPLEVPANAEWIIEGEIAPERQLREGPFGEALGYYGEAQDRPVIKVTAISHRKDPIYQASHMRRPPNEQSALFAVIEAEVIRQCPLAGLADFHLTIGGARLLVGVASIRKSYEAQPNTIALGVLGSAAGQKIKVVIVVDDDIDIRNPTDVEWAVATRCELGQGLQVLGNLQGNPLDPTMPETARVTGSNLMQKLIVDATKPVSRPFPKVISPHPDAVARVNLNWEKYGIHAV